MNDSLNFYYIIVVFLAGLYEIMAWIIETITDGLRIRRRAWKPHRTWRQNFVENLISRIHQLFFFYSWQTWPWAARQIFKDNIILAVFFQALKLFLRVINNFLKKHMSNIIWQISKSLKSFDASCTFGWVGEVTHDVRIEPFQSHFEWTSNGKNNWIWWGI